MLLSLKTLAAAGLCASVATGGAVVTHTSADNRPPAASAGPSVAGDDVTTSTLGDDRGDDFGEDQGDDQGDDDTTSSTVPTTATTGRMTPVAPLPAITVQAAGEAGTVTISTSGGVLTITDVHANAGWTPEIEEASGREVEVSFRNGLHRIDFEAELEDGRIEARVRDRALEQDDTPVTTTPTTAGDDSDDDHGVIDDHGDDRIDDHRDGDADHSGPGRDGDDDHSGSGGGGGDDHSGRG